MVLWIQLGISRDTSTSQPIYRKGWTIVLMQHDISTELDGVDRITILGCHKPMNSRSVSSEDAEWDWHLCLRFSGSRRTVGWWQQHLVTCPSG